MLELSCGLPYRNGALGTMVCCGIFLHFSGLDDMIFENVPDASRCDT
jgi:hypothetical protein